MTIPGSGWEGGSLEDKTAVIINGWFGPGLATARLFADEGARVIITASKQKHLDYELIATNAMYLALPECLLNGLEVYMDGHCQAL